MKFVLVSLGCWGMVWLYCWWCFGKCLVVIVVLLVGQFGTAGG